MVLPMGHGPSARSAVAGRSSLSGALLARVRKMGSTRWGRSRRIGRSLAGHFTGRLPLPPPGGPYDVELIVQGRSVRESLIVPDLCVGEVWIVGGQSNICGTGPWGARMVDDPRVRAFYMDDIWRVAHDPIWDPYAAVDSIHKTLNGSEPERRSDPRPPGAAVTFALERRRKTGLPIGLIASAHPGTTLTQWSPRGLEQGGASLYGAMLRRVRRNGGRVTGLIWYQGEGDAGPGSSERYLPRMEQFVRDLRRDLGDPSLPVLLAQLCRVLGGTYMAEHWNRVQESQRLLSGRVENLWVVATNDLPLGDLIHVDGFAQQELGRRFARASVDRRSGPAIRSIRYHVPYLTADITVELERVDGRLRAKGRPAGFSVRDANGEECTFAVELRGATAVMHTTLTAEQVKSASLSYGYGLDPYCNISDSAGRPLLSAGPFSIPGPRMLTPFVNALRISDVVPLHRGKVSLSRVNRLPVKLRLFHGAFCDVHSDIAEQGGDSIVAFAVDIDCRETMTLRLWLGTDGPLRVWVDRRLVLQTDEGKCPARADTLHGRARVAPGRHKIRISLGGNGGQAWGIFFRMERVDKAGLRSGLLPEVLG